MKPKHLLIDGDIIAYKVAAACEEPVHWGDDQWTLHADAGEGKIQVDSFIDMLTDELKAERLSVFLSSKENFRREIYPEYKAQRKLVRKPMILKPLRDHLFENWNAHSEERLEADDLIGIEATKEDSNYERVIVSVDKDFKTVPCSLFNPDKADEGVLKINVWQAFYNHMIQTLCGDSTDNYGGCPKVGPKTAVKILDKGGASEWDCWNSVREAYTKAGVTSSKAVLTQARMAYILKDGDYDFKTKEVKLWNPPRQK